MLLNNIIINKKYLYTIIMIIILKVILEYGYFVYVYPLYGYSGFSVNISMFKLIESYLIIIILSCFLIKMERYNSPSKIVLYILFINLFLPLSSLYWIQDDSRQFFITIAISFLMIYFILFKTPRLEIFYMKEGKNISIILFVFLTIIVYGSLIASGGLQRMNFNIMNIYETREEFSSNSNFLLGYLLPWQARITNMFFLIYGIVIKNKKLIVFSLILQLLIFSMTGSKSYLFAPIIIIGTYYLFKKGYKNYLLLFISSALSILFTILITLFKFFGDGIALSYFLRRTFYVPAKLHYMYYDFFEDMTKYKLSTSILSFMFENPYGKNPVAFIAERVYEKDFSPNVGIFGDAYLNFGLFGIILFSFLLSVMLKLLDSVAENVPLVISSAIIILPSMALVNSAFFTSILTHGIIFAILVIWLSNSILLKSKDKDITRL